MSHTAIIYASRHHGNTKKLVQSIARKYDITLIDADKQSEVDLSSCQLIGFASGIDFGKFYDCVQKFLEKNLPENKSVFFLYTCARENKRFTAEIKAAAVGKNANILGEFGCRGYNTYGPWKIVGGMNRSHPSYEDLNNAILFYESLLADQEKGLHT